MKFIVTTFLALLISASTYAQSIKYHDVHPDTTVNTWNNFMVFGIDVWWHPSPEVVVKSWGDWEVLCSAGDTLPLALNNGDLIDATSTGSWMKVQYRCLNCYGAVGHWKSTADKYMAARNKSGSGWVYGWARLSVAANGTAFTIKDYAIQVNQNTAIKAGQMIGTSVNNLSHAEEAYQPLMGRGMMSFPKLEGNHKLLMCDVNGRTVFNGFVNRQSAIDISAFPPAAYFLRFNSGTSAKVTRIVIQ